MCGICGIYGPYPRERLDHTIRVMTRTIAHRGPDAAGIYTSDGIALGHRRLSILDLSPTGAQPMSLAPTGTTITYNGEVYNFAELRRELQAMGRVFRGRSDTEVLLHAYDAWGLDGLERLEGIFAFALWDPVLSRMVLVRDRLGVKPLYYAIVGDCVVFGSEIKALLAEGSIGTRLDDQALVEYLWYGNAYEDRTIYREIRSLSPGHRLIIEAGRVREERWWRLEDWARVAEPTDFPATATRVRAALDAAVSRQLVADVPVGIFLSGGIDSSAIAASAMQVQSARLASYSAGFDFDGGVNELPAARRLAEHLGLDHHELHVRGSELPDALQSLARAHDEPFADPASVPLYLLARALGGAVKVVLQGDGGDEMFGGYRRYAILRHGLWWRMWPKSLATQLRSCGKSGARVARLLDAAGARDPAQRMALLLTVETIANSPLALMQPAARQALESVADPFAAYRRCAGRFRGVDPVQQMLLTDICLQLPSQFLPKVDRATMAHGLEARVPLLDERVAELAVGVPSAWKVRGMQKKILLRAAMRGRLPDAVLDAPKTGFGVPYEHWLRGSLHDFARDLVLADQFTTRFGFDQAALRGAFHDHRTGRRDRGFTLWKLLQLALWARRSP